nr:polysaccharide pyruvyl transferase family protein [uncultured Pseudomonas sp.]
MYSNSQICISGAFGEGNFGDDLLLIGYLNFLVKVHNIPQSKIKILSKKNQKLTDQVHKRFPNIGIIQKDRFGIVRTDYNIFAGGTQFYTFNRNIESKFRFLKRIIFHLSHTRVVSEKSIMLNVGLGPFETPPSDRLKEKINNAHYLSVRDRVSLSHCDSFREKNSHHGSDIGYIPSLYTKLDIEKIRAKNNENDADLTALIVLRDWPGFDFSAVIRNIQKTLVKTKVTFSFYIMSPIQDSALRSELENSNCAYREWDETDLDAALLHISNFDFLITSRYHAVVTGAVLNIPSICINIEPKLAIVSKQLKTNLTVESDVPIASLEQAVRELQRDYHNIQSRLASALKIEQQRFDEFTNSFESVAKELAPENN